MKNLRVVLITAASLIILAGAALFLIGYLKEKPGGILVDTTPASNVYINGSLVGKTPFQGAHGASEVTLKLVPPVTDQNLLPFETRITLTSGIQTVVRREFGKTEDESSGDIISFEHEGGQDAGLVVISTPDNAQVSIDGVPRGFAPYKTSVISPAKHQITVKAIGFTDRIMTVNTRAGYKLTVFAKLAKLRDAATPTPAPTPLANQIYVLILDTPTGYLRVRTEPATAGEEIGQVKPGEKYLYLSEDEASGWFKIQFKAPVAGLPNGIVGWISNQYSKKLEPGTATPSATPAR